MSVRYYLSSYTTKVIGGQPSYLPKVATYPILAFSSVGGDDPRATGAWALCVVEANDHTPLLADAEIAALPDSAFDARISSLSNAAKTQLAAALTKFALQQRVTYGNADAWRTVLRKLGALNLASFSEDNFAAAVS